MIIVSQNKKSIYNFDNIRKIKIIKCYNEKHDYSNITFDGGITMKDDTKILGEGWDTLGKYQTEERAKEVLQEIVETYKSQDIEIYNKEPVNEFYKQDFLKEILHKKVVYEMPEE